MVAVNIASKSSAHSIFTTQIMKQTPLNDFAQDVMVSFTMERRSQENQ